MRVKHIGIQKGYPGQAMLLDHAPDLMLLSSLFWSDHTWMCGAGERCRECQRNIKGHDTRCKDIISDTSFTAVFRASLHSIVAAEHQSDRKCSSANWMSPVQPTSAIRWMHTWDVAQGKKCNAEEGLRTRLHTNYTAPR